MEITQVAFGPPTLDGPSTTGLPVGGINWNSPVPGSGAPAVNTVEAQAVPALPMKVANWNTPGSGVRQVNPSLDAQDGVKKIPDTFTFSVLFGLVAWFVIVMVAVLMSPTFIGVGNDGTIEPPTPAKAGVAKSSRASPTT